MRTIVLSIMLVFCVLGSAQIESKYSEVQLKAILEKEFAKVDKTQLSQLVPFKKKDRWGFMYADTRKVAIKPYFTFIDFFNPNFYGYVDGLEVEIIKEPFNIDVYEHKEYCDDGCSADLEKVFVISSKTNFKGFSVTEKGTLESYSDIYYIDDNRRDISEPFEYRYGFYTIVRRNDSCGIIDVFGDPLIGFDFNYKRIVVNDYVLHKSVKWFYVEDFEGNSFFVNTRGQKKLVGGSVKIPLFKNNLFGISVVNNGAVSGVFDLNKMEWLIEPQKKLKIDILYYSSDSDIDSLNPTSRDKANIYFLVRKKNKEFYIDLNLKTYTPR